MKKNKNFHPHSYSQKTFFEPHFAKNYFFHIVHKPALFLEKKFKKYFYFTQTWFFRFSKWKISVGFFFSIFKIDFFHEYRKDLLGLFRIWNYSWRSTLLPEKIFMKVVHFGFQNRQKVVFVSLKKHQKVDYLRRNWLFSNSRTWFVILTWSF